MVYHIGEISGLLTLYTGSAPPRHRRYFSKKLECKLINIKSVRAKEGRGTDGRKGGERKQRIEGHSETRILRFRLLKEKIERFVYL